MSTTSKWLWAAAGRLAAATGAVCILVSAAMSASAQDITRGATVLERPRPEVTPLGIRAGGFLLYPAFGVEERYDDNIFSEDDAVAKEVDDFITIINPQLQIRSNWSNHALNLFGTGSIARHADNNDENYEDFTVGTDGRLDIVRDTNLHAAVAYSKLHEDRGSPDDVRGTEPTEFRLLSPRVGFSRKSGRVRLDLDGTLARFDFDNVSAAGGATINNDDRDRNEWAAKLRMGYEIVPNFEAFVRGSYNVRRYDSRVDDNGFDRESDGFEAVAGTAIEITGITFADVFAGFRSQDFDDPRFETIDGPGFGGSLTWNATKLTTVEALVTRTVEETTIVNAAGFFASRVGLSVDHELLRNVLIGANADYTDSDYRGIGRNDDDINAGAYARYLVNRYLYLTARYRYSERASNVAGSDFRKNVVTLRLETQY